LNTVAGHDGFNEFFDHTGIAGIAPVANSLWMTQIARNVTDAVDGNSAG
jgi:hypothetical protein